MGGFVLRSALFPILVSVILALALIAAGEIALRAAGYGRSTKYLVPV